MSELVSEKEGEGRRERGGGGTDRQIVRQTDKARDE